MGRFFDKLRQVFNLFLLMFFIAAVVAVFVWFLTEPEQRGTAFWMSMGFLGFGLIVNTLFAARVAFRGNSGRAVPGNFSQLFLTAGYFLFVIAAAIVNARMNFSVPVYFLIHVGGLAVFMIPLVLTNMAMLKQDSTERREQQEGRQTLSARASRVRNLAEDMERLLSSGPDSDSNSSQIPAKLKNLSESLAYSDPTPAAKALEKELDEALKDLEDAVAQFEADPGADAGAGSVLRACVRAGRALSARNEAVMNAK